MKYDKKMNCQKFKKKNEFLSKNLKLIKYEKYKKKFYDTNIIFMKRKKKR